MLSAGRRSEKGEDLREADGENAEHRYLVEFEGWRIWHEGDSNGNPEVFQLFGLGAVRLDLALVNFWFALDPNRSRFLQEVLRVDHIGLTHVPIRLEGDAPGKIGMARQYYKDIFLLLPRLLDKVFQNERGDARGPSASQGA